ncbi:MAG: 50S ribosomal protein L27 [Candidatus Colwellbacteria bacterium]|nr:50S ribosomal protein L27 [Candidatus Colwellbacteria bacterium]
MAHTKAGGSTKNLRESHSKRLGVKKHDGQSIQAGEIVIRQRGTKFMPGKGIKRGSDDTLYAVIPGVVRFLSKSKINYDGNKRKVKVVEVRSA